MQIFLDSKDHPNVHTDERSINYTDAYMFVGHNIKYTLANCARTVQFDGRIIGVEIYIEQCDEEKNINDLNFLFNVQTETGGVIQLDEYDLIKVLS